MGGIGYNHIRAGDTRHHSLPDRFPLKTSYPCLYERVSLRLFMLILDLLSAHLEILLMLPFLIYIIQDREKYERQTCNEDNLERHFSRIDQYPPNSALHEERQLFYLSPDHRIGNETHNRYLKYVLAQFNQGL